MDTTYIKMCERAPKEVTEIRDYLELRQYLYCIHHKELLDIGWDNDWCCAGMYKAMSDISNNPQKSDRSEAIRWGKLQRSDDWCEGKHWIRIPSQGDLQEMVREHWTDDRGKPIPHAFYRYEFMQGRRDIEYYEQFEGHEHLWLAFVMKVLCQEIWDGERWVKEEQNDAGSS